MKYRRPTLGYRKPRPPNVPYVVTIKGVGQFQWWSRGPGRATHWYVKDGKSFLFRWSGANITVSVAKMKLFSACTCFGVSDYVEVSTWHGTKDTIRFYFGIDRGD